MPGPKFNFSGLTATAPEAPKSAGFNFAGLTVPEAEPEPEPTYWERGKQLAHMVPPMAMRLLGTVGGGLTGGIAGGLATAPVGGGGAPFGAVSGAIAGTALMDYPAQKYEEWAGNRPEGYNPLVAAVNAGSAAIPVYGRAVPSIARNVLSRGAQGGLQGAATSIASDVAEGQDVNLKGTAINTLLGTALGAGGGRLEAKALQRRIAGRVLPTAEQTTPAAPVRPVAPSVPVAETAAPVPEVRAATTGIEEPATVSAPVAPRAMPPFEELTPDEKLSAVLETAREKNTFTADNAEERLGRTRLYGGKGPQRRGTHPDDLRAHEEAFTGTEFPDQQAARLIEEQHAGLAEAARDDGLTNARMADTTIAGLPAQVHVDADTGVMRVALFDPETDALVAAARVEDGLLEGIGVTPERGRSGIGTSLMTWLDKTGTANVWEVPNRTKPFVALQRRALLARGEAAAAAGEAPPYGVPWAQMSEEQRAAVNAAQQAKAQATKAARAAENAAVSKQRFADLDPELQAELRHIGEVELMPGAPIVWKILQDKGGSMPDVEKALKAYILNGKAPSALTQRAIVLARERLREYPRGKSPYHAAPPLPEVDPGLAVRAQRAEDVEEAGSLAAVESGEGTGDTDFNFGMLSESGAVPIQVATRLGGAAAGGAAGAASADEDASWQERVMRGLGGAAAGLAGGHLVGKMVGGRATPTMQGRVIPPANRTGQTTGKAAGTLRNERGTYMTTGRPAPEPEIPRANPMKGMEVFINKFPEEFRAGIHEVLEGNGAYDAQRRGVMTAAHNQRLSEGIKIDVSRRLKPGTTLPSEGIEAFTNAVATSQQKVKDLAAVVNAGRATDADLVALQVARAENEVLMASIWGVRSEMGRGLAQFRNLARVLRDGNPDLIRDVADGLRKEQAEFAKKFANLPDDPMTRYKWLLAQRGSTFNEKVRSYFYANILSGVQTHERNAIGNAANVASSLVVHPLAATVDVARSALTGKPRTVLFSELPSQLAGFVVGLDKGMSNAMFALKHGVNRTALSGSLSAAESGKLDVPRVEFGFGFKKLNQLDINRGFNPLNLPGRFLDSSDQFFRALSENMELYGRAHAQAKTEGLNGARFQSRMAELVTGDDELSQSIQAGAQAFARRQVFQEKTGAWAQPFQHMVKNVPGAAFVMPFVKTPANILRQGLEFSPAGFAMKAAREGGREGAQGLARASAGTMALGGLAYLAATGRLTGSGPGDPIGRAQLYESGWRPNSIKVGDKYYNYGLFQPIAVQAGIVANAFEAWQAAGAKTEDGEAMAQGVLRSVLYTSGKMGRTMLDQSFLSGVSDLFAAVQEYDRPGAEQFFGRVGHGLTPFSGMQRTVTRAIDPEQKFPQTLKESFLASVPGLSEGVPARQDRFGRDVQQPGQSWLARAADPFLTSKANPDPVLGELGRMNIRMDYPGSKVSGVELSREDERKVAKFKGSVTYNMLQRLVTMPGYARLPDTMKAQMIERTIERTRNTTSGALRGALQGRVLEGR